MLRQFLQNSLKSMQIVRARTFAASASDGSDKPAATLNHADVPIIDYDDPEQLQLPGYPFKPNEPLEVRKARLLYQSRKRGMLENDLLLSTFADKFLKSFSAEQTEQYDKLINGVSNDWDIYYWATENKPTPVEYDNEIMRMLKQHVKNVERESRLRMPNL